MTDKQEIQLKLSKAMPEDAENGVVRLDGLLRRNAKAGIGDHVKIRKAEVKEAEKVVLAPAQKGVQLQILGGGLEKSLMGHPVIKGDIISPIRMRRKASP